MCEKWRCSNYLKTVEVSNRNGISSALHGEQKRETNLNDESDEDSTTQNYEQLECEDTQEADSVVEPASEEREDEGGTPGTATVLPGNSKEKTSRRQTQESPSDLPGSSRENTPTPQKQVKKKDNVAILLKQSIENRGK